MAKYCTVVSPNPFITVKLNMFPDAKALPIRWKNQGLVRYVEKDKVQNMIDLLVDRAQDKVKFLNTLPPVRVYWTECVEELEDEIQPDGQDGQDGKDQESSD
jgi:hypothetical protein